LARLALREKVAARAEELDAFVIEENPVGPHVAFGGHFCDDTELSLEKDQALLPLLLASFPGLLLGFLRFVVFGRPHGSGQGGSEPCAEPGSPKRFEGGTAIGRNPGFADQRIERVIVHGTLPFQVQSDGASRRETGTLL
jgi:hypothetical protein